MKPLLISACLLGVRCKYSGGHNLCPAAEALGRRYHLIPVCPEQLGGLPTPRAPAECQGRRVMTQDGRDVTAAFLSGARQALYLGELFSCQGAVLKSRSPSCGVGSIYDGSFSGHLTKGDGVTAGLLRRAGLRLWTEETLEELEL